MTVAPAAADVPPVPEPAEVEEQPTAMMKPQAAQTAQTARETNDALGTRTMVGRMPEEGELDQQNVGVSGSEHTSNSKDRRRLAGSCLLVLADHRS